VHSPEALKHALQEKADREADIAQQELQELQADETSFLLQLQAVEAERRECAKHMARLDAEERQLAAEEENYWMMFKEFQHEYNLHVSERESLDLRYVHASDQLERLKKTNVFNDTFHIWAEGPFGTINNFRLGRLPTVQVEWNEINAAWGQAVLLLHTMATKLEFTFQKYRLVPLGSHSKIERSDNGQSLELWVSGGIKVFWATRYDQAMVAFLHCLQQFKEFIESQDSRFVLPYKITRDRSGERCFIGDKSIKKQPANSDEDWTRACKYMLTNLKWCITWMCKVQRD